MADTSDVFLDLTVAVCDECGGRVLVFDATTLDADGGETRTAVVCENCDD